jgi:DNA-binding LacI/PurR family transcriptional regulator
VVNPHQVDAGRLATQHLLDLGHETVWHLAGPADWDAAQERRQGWAEALAAAGRRQPEVMSGDWSARSGYQLGRELAARDDVTAVFAANDHQAMGLLRALAEAGRAVPDDVSVIGFDDVPEAEFLVVPLTTVRTHDIAISHLVLSALVAVIEGAEPAFTSVAMARELVVRRSTAPPPHLRAAPT